MRVNLKRMFNVEVIGLTVAVILIFIWIFAGFLQGISFGEFKFVLNEAFFNRLSDIALWCFGALGIKGAGQSFPKRDDDDDRKNTKCDKRCDDPDCKCNCHDEKNNKK